MKNEKAITLVALVITIIVMLILVGITVTAALKGRLFETTKEAATKTELEENKEILLTLAIGTMGKNTNVDYTKMDSNLPNGFKGRNGKYIKGNVLYTVDTYGNVETIQLPEEGYTWVEYLESNGKQQIDTGTNLPSSINKVEADILFTNKNTYQGIGGKWQAQFGVNNGKVYMSSEGGYSHTFKDIDNDWHHYCFQVLVGNTVNSGTLTLDYNDSITGDLRKGTYWGNFYLFAARFDALEGNCKNYAKYGIVKMYKNDELKRFYIPTKDSSGKPCMYDIVSKQAFYNSSSNGVDFTTGPEI